MSNGMRWSEDQLQTVLKARNGCNGSQRVAPSPGRPTKHFARARMYDGKRFGSGDELERWKELEMLEKSGAITNLTHQPRWNLVVRGMHIGRYTADASWLENGSLTVEDTKSRSGWKSRDYPLRKKLMKALYSIEIHEHVRSSKK